MKFQTLSFLIGISAAEQVKGMEKAVKAHTPLFWKAEGRTRRPPVVFRSQTTACGRQIALHPAEMFVCFVCCVLCW
jgi:hypothetical protein